MRFCVRDGEPHSERPVLGLGSKWQDRSSGGKAKCVPRRISTAFSTRDDQREEIQAPNCGLLDRNMHIAADQVARSPPGARSFQTVGDSSWKHSHRSAWGWSSWLGSADSARSSSGSRVRVEPAWNRWLRIGFQNLSDITRLPVEWGTENALAPGVFVRWHELLAALNMRFG